MPEQGETPTQLPPEEQRSEPRPENIALWKETMQNQARSLLGKYLPTALPQEPTEILFDNANLPHYIGKFKNKHYLTIASAAEEEIESSYRDDAEFEKSMKATDELLREGDGEIDLEPLEDQGEDFDWEKEIKKDAKDYSTLTWSYVFTAIHEMTHQRQAEIYPNVFPEISSPTLENIDPEKTNQIELSRLLNEASEKNWDTISPDSLLRTVIEGMASIGEHHIMAQLEVEFRSSGNFEAAKKIRRLNEGTIRAKLKPHRNLKIEDDKNNFRIKHEYGDLKEVPSYLLHYMDGIRIMRKLNKKMGMEGAIKFLQNIDLAACKEITRGTPEFQKFVDDPTTLPQINTTSVTEM